MEAPISTHTAPVPRTATGGRRRWWALALLCVAQFMLVLDVTVVNVALPDIGAGLHLTRTPLTWVVTAYALAFGGLMLLGGRLADLYGARRTLLAGLAVFTAASLASGLAPDAAVLLGGRVLQGAGAALLSPAALSIVTTTFTGPERGRALGVWAALGGTGSAAGVLLGGALTAGPGWPWIFFINVPVGVALLALLPAVVPATARSGAGGLESTARPGRRLDVLGALTVTAATGSLIYGLTGAGDRGWTAPGTLVPLGAAVLLYAAFTAVERSVRVPLMRVRMLTRRPVAAGTLLMLVASGLLISSFFLGSFALQHQHRYGALATGLAFLPVAIGTIVGAQASSHTLPRAGARPVATAGLAVTAAGAALAAFGTGVPALVAGIAVAATGLGATIVAATTTALAHTDHHHAGLASGIVNTSHELGGALGVATASTLAAASLTGAGATGFTHAFAAAAATALTAAVLAALLTPAGKPPAGMTPHVH
jgi:EmrB/QacA subfamily drug resistance transporter